MATADTIIGETAGLAGVMNRVRIVAASDAPVLLLGETGSGKEVIARAVHERSRGAAGPFWRVNCGALPPELIDAELFGHERGAFTGATGTRRGWFELAHQGTLFLDEVGELPPAAQVRLLRVVQDGELVRLGAEKPIAVDVRIVAATHRDLPAMVAAREFREDLYYRLAVFPIVIPPLRDRPEDVRPLAEYFAARAANRFGLRRVAVDDVDVARLTAYPWPGNVRELAAVLDRAVLLGEGRALAVRAALGGEPRPARATASPPTAVVAPPTGDAIAPLDDVVRAHLHHALTVCHGRIDGPFGAARQLGVNPHTLRARMRKLGLDWRSYRGR